MAAVLVPLPWAFIAIRKALAGRGVNARSAPTQADIELGAGIHDLQLDFEEIADNSPALLEALYRVVSATDATVLILGKTGTGKDLVARAIHARSHRRDRTFISVNCAAIPATLMESELFGHEKGAFTGAANRRKGLFERADGGTLFLDEVSELALDVQVKLLRVLQKQEVQPVGATHTVPIDVRVIASSSCDLRDAVRAGQFREDLFHRLNVMPIAVPPLRLRVSHEMLLRVMGTAAAGSEKRTIKAAMAELERASILEALKATGGVLEGSRGAAQVLGCDPATLRRWMRKLGVSSAPKQK